MAILNDIADRLPEVNGKARRNKRAQKCSLVSLRYDTVREDDLWKKERNFETHRIIFRFLVNETVVLQVVLCRLLSISFLNSLTFECKKDKTKSFLTHGTTPVNEDVACLMVINK